MEENKRTRPMVNKIKNDNEVKEISKQIEVCISKGVYTKEKIARALGITRYELNKHLAKCETSRAIIKVGRSLMGEIAVDNLQDMLTDKNHSNHWQATNHVLKNHKTELDEAIEAKDGDGAIGLTGGKAKRVNITFE